MIPEPIMKYIKTMRADGNALWHGRLDSLDRTTTIIDILENLDLLEMELLMYDIKKRRDNNNANIQNEYNGDSE